MIVLNEKNKNSSKIKKGVVNTPFLIIYCSKSRDIVERL